MAAADDILASASQRAPQLATPTLSAKPKRKLAVLTCMDTRLDPLRMLGLQVGEAHIIRNAGGLATDDAIRSLSISQRVLGTEEILVIMHERCGLLEASEDEFKAVLAAEGTLPSWRLGAFDDLEGTLRASIARLRSSLELASRARVVGLIYDPHTGALREISG